MATRIAIMADGRVAQIGTPREVYDRPTGRFVADFVGETNCFRGVVRMRDSRPIFDLEGGDRVDVPAGSREVPFRPS